MAGTPAGPARVRTAAPADLPLLAPIELAAGERFRAIGMDAVADDDPAFPDDVLAAALDEQRLWVADAAPTLVGYALALDLDGQPYLEQVSVLPEWSGRGVGRALIDEVARWARERADSLVLSTFRDVAWNAPLYAHLGFETLAEAEVRRDPRLLSMREAEARDGLDPTLRVFMRRAV